MSPARSRSLCERISASAGGSRSVAIRVCVQRMKDFRFTTVYDSRIARDSVRAPGASIAKRSARFYFAAFIKRGNSLDAHPQTVDGLNRSDAAGRAIVNYIARQRPHFAENPPNGSN